MSQFSYTTSSLPDFAINFSVNERPKDEISALEFKLLLFYTNILLVSAVTGHYLKWPDTGQSFNIFNCSHPILFNMLGTVLQMLVHRPEIGHYLSNPPLTGSWAYAAN